MKKSVQDALITGTVCCVTVLSVSIRSFAHPAAYLNILQIFLTGATAVAITTIGRDLDFKQSDLQWPLNVYSYVAVRRLEDNRHLIVP